MATMLTSLHHLNLTLIQKLEDQGKEAWINFNLCEHMRDVIIKNGGIENTSYYETHRLQDRGNCAWKGFSTWIHKQCEGIYVSITDSMIQRCREKYPYFEQSLIKLRAAGTPMPLHYFMKMIAYERVHAQLSSLFSVSLEKDSTDQIHEKIKAKTSVYAKTACERYLKERPKKSALDEKKVELYLSTLALNILQSDATTRYQSQKKRQSEF
jgi:hypothetical protein